MVLTASFALSLATGLSCHHRLADTSAKLDASVGASGPHDFSVRFSAVRYRRFHVHRIPSRVRDDREPPLCGTGRREYAGDLGFRKTRIFFQAALDMEGGKLPGRFARQATEPKGWVEHSAKSIAVIRTINVIAGLDR
jgi:hypothetical protein